MMTCQAKRCRQPGDVFLDGRWTCLEHMATREQYTDAEWRADIEAKETRERLDVIESSKDGGKA